MTLASIVEREAVLDAERPLIAGVYLNRINHPNAGTVGLLNADPTLQYGLATAEFGSQPISSGRAIEWWPQLQTGGADVVLPEELAGYQTYLVKGLPPSPIASPRIASIARRRGAGMAAATTTSWPPARAACATARTTSRRRWPSRTPTSPRPTPSARRRDGSTAMIDTGDIKKGVIIELDGQLMKVLDWTHIKMARGSAQVRMKLQNVRRGDIVERTFQAGTRWPRARVEQRKVQYLYGDGDAFHFMDNETYDQFAVERQADRRGRALPEGGDGGLRQLVRERGAGRGHAGDRSTCG